MVLSGWLPVAVDAGHDVLGPLMFVVVFLTIFLGYPVAFSLGGVALVFAWLGVQGGYFGWEYLELFPERVFGVMSNSVLLAVPYFIFMGTMLERSRLAEDLLRTIGLLFGPMRGGLDVRGGVRRCVARCRDRRRRCVGRRDGADLAADHAALRLPRRAGHGCDLCRGNARADRAAERRARRARRPARRERRGSVPRRADPGSDARGSLRGMGRDHRVAPADVGAGDPARRARGVRAPRAGGAAR